MMHTDLPILSFSTQADWHVWLDQNHSTSNGIWVRFYKKASKIPTIMYAEALEEVLCYGWIDGLAKSYDEVSYLQRYTPRRPKSLWSKINVQHAERLIEQGRMQPAGFAAIESAKSDGRWQKAYASAKNMVEPKDFLQLLEADMQAKRFYESLNKQNKYAIAFRLHNTKKPETRQKKLQQFFEMMKKGEKFY